METTLENLKVTTATNGVGLSFTPIADSSLAYIAFIQSVHPNQLNKVAISGKEGVWSQALGWFNPAGNAFWDGRQTSVGPALTILVGAMSNALPLDGGTYNLFVQIYQKGVNEMNFVANSQNVAFTAPNLLSATPVPTAQTPVEPTPASTAGKSNRKKK
jgi:hypothetical protein